MESLRTLSIKILETNKLLSANAGLLSVATLIKRSGLQNAVESSLPCTKTGSSRNWVKFSNLIMGFAAGAECLEDLAHVGDDPVFKALSFRAYHPKSYGNFLRSFSGEDIWHLQTALIKVTSNLRHTVAPYTDKLILDCDSTLNRQYGKKMEGVEVNYEGYEGLSTLNIFDQFGLQYFLDVRPGATHTSLGIEDPVHRLLSSIHQDYADHKKKRPKVCFRADSGYYKTSFINACLAKGADVLVAVNKRGDFYKIANQVNNWRPTDISDPKRIKFYDGRECEIGSTRYRPTGAAQRMRYVIMRAEKPAVEGALFPEQKEYDYYAFCTNYSEIIHDDEAIITKYRKRGQAENYIKENKYGFDLKHYPCLKLLANRAYGLVAAFAYNFLRLMALLDNPDKPAYAKRTRNRWIHIPCIVARSARDSVFRYMTHHAKEMSLWLKRIHKLQFGFG